MTTLTHDFPSHQVLAVEVTAEDIEKGRRRDSWNDPICRALFRATGEKWVVEETTCYPITKRNAFIPLPPEVISFIAEFDATGWGNPFRFRLEMP